MTPSGPIAEWDRHTPDPDATTYPALRLREAERLLRGAGVRDVGVGEYNRHLVYSLQRHCDGMSTHDRYGLLSELREHRDDIERWLEPVAV